MSRNLSNALIEQTTAPHIIPVLLACLNFVSGPLLCNTGLNSVVWNTGATPNWRGEYLGIGMIGQISAIEEGTSAQAFGATFTLSGIPQDAVSASLNADYAAQMAWVWLAFLDENYQIIDTPTMLFAGRMDTMNIGMGDTAAITLTAESRLADLGRVRARRFNHQDQIAHHPDDKGLIFAAAMVDKEIAWGV